MPISALRDRLTEALVAFAWDEWAQMGVLASARRRSDWAQDPEALIVFTLEVARQDARLFDELLDWWLVNDDVLSGWRLRALSDVPGDAGLVGAASEWVARHGGRRRSTLAGHDRGRGEPEALFRTLRGPTLEQDEAFAAYGLLRPVLRPGGKSLQPDMLAPINLAFRLRQLFGPSTRAEVIRCLLTIEAPRVSAPVLAQATGFSVRNVHEALASLHSARVVLAVGVSNELRYAADREQWAAFLGNDGSAIARHRDWPQLLGALRRILRWLWRPALDGLSDYLLASAARDLLEEVGADLAYAGVPVDYGRTVDEALAGLQTTIDRALASLGPYAEPAPAEAGAPNVTPRPSPSRVALEVFQGSSGEWRWRLRGGNGQAIAESAGTLRSRHAATDAARYFASRAHVLTFEAHSDDFGRVWWSAREADGGIVARSADAFASRSNARRAAASVQRRLHQMPAL